MKLSSEERSTRQRNAMQDVVVAANRPLLAHEVLALAQLNVPGLGIATVYRNLKAMVDNGTLLQVVLPGQNPRYEMASHGHHHHFHCSNCELVFDIHACPKNLAGITPPGFTLEHHDLTLYGKCPSCNTLDVAAAPENTKK